MAYDAYDEADRDYRRAQLAANAAISVAIARDSRGDITYHDWVTARRFVDAQKDACSRFVAAANRITGT